MEKDVAQKTSQEKNISEKQAQISASKEKINKSAAEHIEISMKEFLDFLRTAYQVSDTVEDILSSEGMSDAVDWIKLKNTQLILPRAVSCQTSSTDLSDGETLHTKLDDILNEGFLDSVLPYMVPPNGGKKSQSKISDKGSHSSGSNRSSSSKNCDRKKSNEAPPKPVKTDSEVEIHVSDDIKNLKKDFICSQKLLIEKMGYFAEITAGQKLEDIDISVHCDIQIFEWLMHWIKREQLPEEDWPKLDPQCVIPVVVSAAFLQMEPLVHDCLLYCHENMNEILQNASNLNCLNDSLINRLAAMYTNSELEQIKDKRDKIQSRLYCKMIISLCDPVCESVRGHWNSLARIYRCVRCEQLVMPEIASRLPCRSTCMSIDRYGDISSHHQRDPSWDINEYITMLQMQLKTWRKVYWRLWGDCHFLFCIVCEKPFPAHSLRWCCYHPGVSEYFTLDSQKAPLPVGRYSCCGERGYRFQLLHNYSGCQFQDHVPRTTKAKDAAVFNILENFRHVIDTTPPDLIFPERLTRLVAKASDGKLACKEVFWWDGIQLTPAKQQGGILGPIANTVTAISEPVYENTVDDSSDELSSSESTSSTDHSEESIPSHVKCVPKRKLPKKKILGRLWQQNLSARSNQDLQRANEETVLSRMVSYLSKKSSLEVGGRQKGWMRHVTPPGGIYSRLEAEWREANSYPGALPRRCPFVNKPKFRVNRIS